MAPKILARTALAGLFLTALALPATLVTSAQDATPGATMAGTPAAAEEPLVVELIDAEGNGVGAAALLETDAGVAFALQVQIEGLPPGEHGWHLHERGLCDGSGAEPFSSAGGHWNPTMMMHGAPDAPEHHVGDFGNLIAGDDGLAEAEIVTADYSLGEGPSSVFDEDGTAIIVHLNRDDLTTQPSGNSGPRVACGIVAEPEDMAAAMAAAQAAAAATPVAATPVGGMATPAMGGMATPAMATPTS